MDGIKEVLGYFTSGEARDTLIQLGPLALPLFTAVVEGTMGYQSARAPERRQRLLAMIGGFGLASSLHLASRAGGELSSLETTAYAGAAGYAVGALLGMVRNR